MEILYDEIGKNYDYTRKADAEITRRLHHHLGNSNGNIIDIACGTGNYTVAISNYGMNMVGLDISPQMIENAQKKSDQIKWILADVKNMPLESNNFDGATCILSIHHFTELNKSFKEINRILKEGSRLVIFTSEKNQMKDFWLNEYFPIMMKNSINQMPDKKTVHKYLVEAGFINISYEKYFIKDDLQDLFLYSGKHKPALYLDPEIRKGSSSFSNLAFHEEIEEGVAKLKRDIESGRIDHIIPNYENNNGDYLFVISEK